MLAVTLKNLRRYSILVIGLVVLPLSASSAEEDASQLGSSNLPAGTVVPSDIGTAVEELHKALSEDQRRRKAELTEDEFLLMHRFGLGSWIRKEWLYEGSPLSNFFADHGVVNAEDSSWLILRGLWRSLKQRPIAFDSMIAEVHQLAAASEAPANTECPNHPGAPMKLLHRELSRAEGGGYKVTRFAYCAVSNSYWAYEIGGDWKEPTPEQLRFLKANYKQAREE